MQIGNLKGNIIFNSPFIWNIFPQVYIDQKSNCGSVSLKFDSQPTKHQTILPIVVHWIPIVIQLFFPPKYHQTILPIVVQKFLIRSESQLVWTTIGFLIYLSLIYRCFVPALITAIANHLTLCTELDTSPTVFARIEV